MRSKYQSLLLVVVLLLIAAAVPLLASSSGSDEDTSEPRVGRCGVKDPPATPRHCSDKPQAGANHPHADHTDCKYSEQANAEPSSRSDQGQGQGQGHKQSSATPGKISGLVNEYFPSGLLHHFTFPVIALLSSIPIAMMGFVGRFVWRRVDEAVYTHVKLADSTRSYEWFSYWLERQPLVLLKEKNVELTENNPHAEDSTSHRSRSTQDDRFTQIHFRPAAGVTRRVPFTDKHGKVHTLIVSRNVNEKKHSTESEFEITLVNQRWLSDSNSKAIIRELIATARAMYMKGQEKTTTIYTNDYSWECFGRRMKRPLSSVHHPPELIRDIVNDIAWWLASPDWYQSKGLPYRRGYLLHGKPGTGKSSLIFALAGHFNLPVCQVNLADEDMSDSRIPYLLNSAPAPSIILFEEIDTAFGPLKGKAAKALKPSQPQTGVSNGEDGDDDDDDGNDSDSSDRTVEKKPANDDGGSDSEDNTSASGGGRRRKIRRNSDEESSDEGEEDPEVEAQTGSDQPAEAPVAEKPIFRRKKTNLSFNGLLNALDGVSAQEGRIIFMTTNHRERLDPALVRPGRIDREFEFLNATSMQIEAIFRRFFHDDPYYNVSNKAATSSRGGGVLNRGSAADDPNASLLSDTSDAAEDSFSRSLDMNAFFESPSHESGVAEQAEQFDVLRLDSDAVMFAQAFEGHNNFSIAEVQGYLLSFVRKADAPLLALSSVHKYFNLDAPPVSEGRALTEAEVAELQDLGHFDTLRTTSSHVDASTRPFVLSAVLDKDDAITHITADST